jgi:hypothetical protein
MSSEELVIVLSQPIIARCVSQDLRTELNPYISLLQRNFSSHSGSVTLTDRVNVVSDREDIL